MKVIEKYESSSNVCYFCNIYENDNFCAFSRKFHHFYFEIGKSVTFEFKYDGLMEICISYSIFISMMNSIHHVYVINEFGP